MKRPIRHIVHMLLPLFAIAVLGSCHTSKKSDPAYYQSQIDRLGKGKGNDNDRNVTSSVKLSKVRKKIVEEACTWLGTPYRYSHAEKGVATDCSGMVLQVYETVAGIKLPRNSAQQSDFCINIRKKDVKIGDLVFFATGKDRDRISHVGIMLDDSSFIHASASKGVVISDINQPYYERTFKGFGRVPD